MCEITDNVSQFLALVTRKLKDIIHMNPFTLIVSVCNLKGIYSITAVRFVRNLIIHRGKCDNRCTR